MKKLDLIMLIEDDPTATFLAHRVLKNSSLAENLCTARNGKQALTFIQSHFGAPDYHPLLPSVLLVDISMPVMGGFEFLRQLDLLHLKKRPWVVMLSSSRKKDDVEKAFQLNADGYFTKPFRIEDLTEFLTTVPQ
ncbi:response regulator [Nibribacter ruber]|uniref:Response regulator n=1 Tax=Nibribacter ruber TaxID=2698458 RepID=A0A6P1NYX5_9BACT|nr:response regulator [Nibribacter ruber]QHL87178.1 response regulator [Nibribacter ruber]